MSYANCEDLRNIVRCALREDIGAGDITTFSLVPADRRVKAVLLAKEPCVICGLQVAALTFRLKDKGIKFIPKARDGDFIKKGKVIAVICGNARGILTAERVALNFLSLLSGISTETRKFAEVVKPYKIKIMDTRKTIPGLRVLEKYAVRIGGGFNHRLSLGEMILVKDNHIKVTGSYRELPKVTGSYKVEMEVKNLKEFKEALELRPDVIMLDNMKIEDIRKAVRIKRTAPALPAGRHSAQRNTQLEASGGIILKNVKKIAATGVDMISVGALTHSVKSVDISLEIL